MIKVSILIPVYNVEKHLERCLDSLCGQTLKDIEIICINDCSTDNSLEILQQYAQKDERVRIISFAEKQNAAIARNKGLEIAQGEYLGFVDSDDYIDLNFYEKLYTKAKEEQADIVKGNILEATVSGKLIKSKMNDNIIASQEKMQFFSEWVTAIYKKSLIENYAISFPSECPKAHDIVFLVRCVIKAKKISLINDVYYYYKRRIGSLDQPKLSSENANSAILSCGLICEALNIAKDDEITENGYVYAYLKRLVRFLYLFYVNDVLECKDYALSSFFYYYRKMKYKDKIINTVEYTKLNHIFELVKCNNEKAVREMLFSCTRFENLYTKNVVYSLRQNVIKDMKNA